MGKNKQLYNLVIYTGKWRRVRRAYLKAHPYCVKCLLRGVIKRAAVVDHITPHQGDERLMWDAKNYQSLCASCHNKKTAEENK